MIEPTVPDILDNQPLHELAALVSGRMSPCRISANQWPLLVDLAQRNGLAAMLLRSIKSSGIDSATCPGMQALETSARLTGVADMLYEDSLRTISEALASADIPTLWLKGAVLARTVYPQSLLRPMGDLDVLVPKVKLEAALDILRSLGYAFNSSITFRPDSPERTDEEFLKHLAHHHYVLVGGISESVNVELHFGLPAHVGDSLLSDEQLEWFWDHTQPFYLSDNTRCVGMNPEAQLLYLAAHNIFQHGESQSFLMRDLDVHLLVTDSQPDWNMVIDRAVVLGWTSAVARTLERAKEYFDTPVPEMVIEHLVTQRPSYEDPLLAQKKLAPGYRLKKAQQVLSRLSIREKFRYIFQNLFPTVDFMRSRYKVSPGQQIWPYYPYRWFDQGREVFRGSGWQMKIGNGSGS